MRTLYYFIVLLFITVNPAHGEDSKRDIPFGCELIGTVLIRSASIDAKTMMEIDALVPKLMKIGEGKVVKIEGHDSLAMNKSEHVKRSLDLAKQVEKYLRTKHKIPFDLYIGAKDAVIEKNSKQVIRIIAYPYDFTEIKI
jgi:hypothetical protein